MSTSSNNMLYARPQSWLKTITKITNKLKKENPTNPFLSNSEKIELFLDYKNNGNLKARDKLLETMYPFAVQLCTKYLQKNNVIPHEDLQQEANLALLDSLDEYDPSLGSFPTYFRSRIGKYIFPAIKRYSNIIRQPDNILKNITLETKAFDDFVTKEGRYPKHGEEYVFAYKDKKHKVTFGKNYIPNVVSGNDTLSIGDDSEYELFDIISQKEDEDENLEKKQLLKKIISKFSAKEKQILYYLFETSLDTKEIIQKLTPTSRGDKIRLEESSKNVLKFITNFGEETIIIHSYYNAIKFTEGELNDIGIVFNENISKINKTPNQHFKYSFGLKNDCKIIDIVLNGKSILDSLKKDNNDIYTISSPLKIGTVYTVQNLNVQKEKLILKLRKKIKTCNL